MGFEYGVGKDFKEHLFSKILPSTNHPKFTAIFADASSFYEKIQALKAAITKLAISDIVLAETFNKEQVLDLLDVFEEKDILDRANIEEAKAFKNCCTACGDKEWKVKTCCKLVWYCSKKCQRDHWPEHKDECMCR